MDKHPPPRPSKSKPRRSPVTKALTIEQILSIRASCLASDFDDTLIREHTQGRSFSPGKVDPNHFMIELIGMFLDIGKPVAIVTFGQQKYVERFSENYFGRNSQGNLRVPVFSSTMDDDKNSLIHQAFPEVPNNEILLIDDDLHNLRSAARLGVQTLRCIPYKDWKVYEIE